MDKRSNLALKIDLLTSKYLKTHKTISMDNHYLQSSYREKLIEHLFIGEMLKHSWLCRNCALEIARPEVDNSGYDLIAEDNGIVRHIQFKTAHYKAQTPSQKINIKLASKPSGCVVWIQFDSESMDLGPYLFFGNLPGRPLPDLAQFKIAKHTKGNAKGIKLERPGVRVVPKSQFHKFDTIEEVYRALFG